MLEVCVDTIQAARVAASAGADRIELCSHLDVGGVTPPWPIVYDVRREIDLPLIVLIRSRAGGFVYSNDECEQMLQHAETAIKLGADGVAVGGLTHSLELHLEFLRSVSTALPKSQIVMHRAFDFVPDPFVALEHLVELSYTRILTSGGGEMAIDGTNTLCRLGEQAQGRIEILPAGGIAPSNALTILKESGARQLHGSFRIASSGKSQSSLPNLQAIKQTKAILNDSTLGGKRHPSPNV